MATKDGDLTAIAESVDFLGVNYYSPLVVDGRGQPVSPIPYPLPAGSRFTRRASMTP